VHPCQPALPRTLGIEYPTLLTLQDSSGVESSAQEAVRAHTATLPRTSGREDPTLRSLPCTQRALPSTSTHPQAWRGGEEVRWALQRACRARNNAMACREHVRREGMYPKHCERKGSIGGICHGIECSMAPSAGPKLCGAQRVRKFSDASLIW
jgi:hypothetical protein